MKLMVSVIRIRLRRFLSRRLGFLVRIFYIIRFRIFKLLNKKFIIILTIGKVGSSSVYYSLRKQLNIPIFHIHHFSPTGILENKSRHLGSDRKSLPLHLIVSEELRKVFPPDITDYKIITLIRDPISRTISSFFQNTEMYRKKVENRKLHVDPANAIQIINKMFETDSKLDEEWFEQEIHNNFDIDVFQEPFNLEQGYRFYSNDHHQLLLLRLENLNENFSRASHEFLNIHGLKLYVANVAENKIYNATYGSFKKSFKLTTDQWQKISNTKFFDKFYRDKKDSLRTVWSNQE